VTFETLLVSDLSSRRYFEAFFGAGVCFYLRHFTWFIITPLRHSPPGDLFGASSGNRSLSGNSVFKRGAKIVLYRHVTKHNAKKGHDLIQSQPVKLISTNYG
jgi:hypothetical protein